MMMAPIQCSTFAGQPQTTSVLRRVMVVLPHAGLSHMTPAYSAVIPPERRQAREPGPMYPCVSCWIAESQRQFRDTWVPGLQRTTPCCAAPGMAAEIFARHVRQPCSAGGSDRRLDRVPRLGPGQSKYHL